MSDVIRTATSEMASLVAEHLFHDGCEGTR
mgnify:CR=1 FL=1